MAKKVIYSTVIYSCDKFDVFLDEYLKSVFDQSDNTFELLILLDDIEEVVIRKKLEILNVNDITVHIYVSDDGKTPLQLRKELIDISYAMDASVLIFSDFDETVACNRVEVIKDKIEGVSFVFNDFYVVDSMLRRMSDKSFFSCRKIPEHITDWRSIKSFNYIGFGSLAINLTAYDYRNLCFPDDIIALDWFLATKVLLDGGDGLSLGNTYANYRQHDNSLVGFDFMLDIKKLKQGLMVKEAHYRNLKNDNDEIFELYAGIKNLMNYINSIGDNKYIDAVNSSFNTEEFCWWENIKLEHEITNDT